VWIPDFILKWLGRSVADKLDLQEGQMDGTKKWYQSKNIWTAVISGVLGMYMALAPQLHWPSVPEWLFTILAAIGVYTRVSATDKIG
jgi:hypothetical protein